MVLKLLDKMLNRPERKLLEDLETGEIKPIDFLRIGLTELSEVVEQNKKGNKIDFNGSDGKYALGLDYIQRTGKVDEKVIKLYNQMYQEILSNYLKVMGIELDELYFKPEERFENETPEQERKRRAKLEKEVHGFVNASPDKELSKLERNMISLEYFDDTQ